MWGEYPPQIIIDKWSGLVDYLAMADHSVPDYELDEILVLDRPEQFKALFEETRLHIIDMLTERAATISQLADALDRVKGTIGHHVKVLAQADLIRVVRTEKVRAIEAKYYGRTARTFELSRMVEAGIEPNVMISAAAAEIAAANEEFASHHDVAGLTTVRYARIPTERAAEWERKLNALVDEFVTEPRSGEVVYGLAVALYPTVRPHLPDRA